VPDLFVADFGIASHVQTIGTRITGQRGTPGYEAPVWNDLRCSFHRLTSLQEIRGQGYQAAFSQKSDIYAFGCILYRLCSLAEPLVVDDIKPLDISMDYSIELLTLVSTMLSTDRDARPIAVHVKEQLAAIATKLFKSGGETCHSCKREFISKNGLRKHLKKTGHGRKDGSLAHDTKVSELVVGETSIPIRGAADAPAKYYYDDEELDAPDPSPCIVCNKYFNTKRQFFGHLHGVHHYRGLKYVRKRKAEESLEVDVEKEDERLAKWVRKDMMRHDD